MYIYYPSNAVVYIRQVGGGQVTEQYISYAPNQIIIISGSYPPIAATNFVTSGFALTASFALNGGVVVGAFYQLPFNHALNQWYLVCGVRQGNLCTLYVNGIYKNSNTYAGALNVSSNSTKIGIAGSTIPFAGLIDSVRIYNRALSSKEVFMLYNNT